MFQFSLQPPLESFLAPTNFIELRSSWTETRVGLMYNVRCLCPILTQTAMCRQRFAPNFTTIHSAGLLLGHTEMQTDRQRDSATRSNRPGLSKSPARNTDGSYRKKALVSSLTRQEGIHEQPCRNHSHESTTLTGRPISGGVIWGRAQQVAGPQQHNNYSLVAGGGG